jgi:hypothetical protein
MKIKPALAALFFISVLAANVYAQQLPYGVVIGSGGTETPVQSFLKQNEQGIRVSVIRTRGLAMTGGIVGVGGAQNMNVLQLDVPTDTDYLELLLFYLRMDPRMIRKNKIKLLRIEKTGQAPYRSAEIKRFWTHYNFQKQYKIGGPFDLVQPGDIIIIEEKGILNREYFDFLADVRFLVSLPTLILSGYLLVQTLRK